LCSRESTAPSLSRSDRVAAAQRDDHLVDVLDLGADVGVAAERNLDRRAGVEGPDRLDRLVDLGLLGADVLDLVLDGLLFLF